MQENSVLIDSHEDIIFDFGSLKNLIDEQENEISENTFPDPTHQLKAVKKAKTNYDMFTLMSALQKSIRWCDVNASRYFAKELVEMGKPGAVINRLLIIASEDVGLADPSLLASVNAVILMTFACAPSSYRKHPEFEAHTQNIKNLGLIPPDVKIYEISAGGTRELRDDWSAIGKENVMSTALKYFNEKKSTINSLTVDSEMEEEMEDILALYRAVSISIQTHTYGPYLFPEKQKNFNYSIGPIEDVLKKYEVDSLVFVYGIDEISTGGRKASMVVGLLAGMFTGVAVMPRAGITAVNIAVVDSSGSIIWYNIKGSSGGYDLRKPESAAVLVKDMLADFPSFER